MCYIAFGSRLSSVFEKIAYISFILSICLSMHK